MSQSVVKIAALSMGLAVGGVGFGHAAPVSVSYYSMFADTGTDVTVSGNPFRTGSIASINSSADKDFPDPSVQFGAIFSTSISVSAAGSYTFALGSDDASYLYIDGMEVGTGLPGTHPYYTENLTTMLSAGTHTLRVDYDNSQCCRAAVDLTLASGTSYVSSVPLPATLPMFGIALLGLGAVGYGIKRSKGATA